MTSQPKNQEELFIDWGSPGLPSKGVMSPDYMIIGIAPSTSRPQHRAFEPFGSSSYELLQTIRKKLSQDGKTLYVTNLIKIPKKPRVKLLKKDWVAWLPRLIKEIEQVKPKRILTVGALPAKQLIPGFRNLREDHGTLFTRDFGYGDVTIVPSYHFSVIKDFPKLIQNDLIRFFTLEDPVEPKYKIVELAELLDQLKDSNMILTVDVETTGVKVGQSDITMLGVKLLHSDTGYIIVDPTMPELRTLTRKILQRNTILGHNLSFDLSMIFNGADFESSSTLTVSKIRSIDTMNRAHILGEEILGLKHLATMYTSRSGAHGFGGPESPAYLAEDLFSTEELYLKLNEQNPDLEDRFITLLSEEAIPKLGLMRARGVYIDREKLDKIGENLLYRQQQLEKTLPFGVNWNSPMQVAEALQQSGIVLTMKTPTGKYSTSEQALIQLAAGYSEDSTQGQLIQDVRSYRAVIKQYKGFVVGYHKLSDAEGFLHPNLKIAATRTGRFSCTSPNLQQVPRLGPLKTIFIPRWVDGLYGLMDLSQAELRVAALLSEDEALLKNLMSTDPHRANAAMLYDKPEEEVSSIERKKSKAIMFGVLYGGSAKGLASRTKFSVASIQEAMTLLQQRFPKLNRWIRATEQQGLDRLEVRTLFGRVRNLEQVFREESFGGVRRKAVNTPIQSLASDINLFLMNEIAKDIEKQNLNSYPLFLVHDSVLIEIAPDEQQTLEYIVQQAFKKLEFTPLASLNSFDRLPIMGEFIIGRSWAEVESTNEAYRPLKEIGCSSHG